MDKVMERRTLGVNYDLAELRAEPSEDGDGRRLLGHAAVFDSMSKPIFGMFREIIRPGAFRDAINKDDVLALQNHDQAFLIARTSAGTLRLSEDYRGLMTDVPKVPDLSYANDLLKNVELGNIRSMSFAFMVGDEGEDKWHDEGELDELPVREVIRVSRLFDISYVPDPAYDDTDVAKRSFEAWQVSAEAWKRDAQARSRTLELMKLGG